MKVIGWNEYKGNLENGKPYCGYYLYLTMPIPQGVQGAGERVKSVKVRSRSAAYSKVPMLMPGDEITSVYYDERGNCEEIVTA